MADDDKVRRDGRERSQKRMAETMALEQAISQRAVDITQAVMLRKLRRAASELGGIYTDALSAIVARADSCSCAGTTTQWLSDSRCPYHGDKEPRL